MGVPMPAAVVLIVCKSALLPDAAQDQNANWTGVQSREWVIEHGRMICQRKEIQLFDSAEAQGADPKPFNQHACMAAGIMAGVDWDQRHRGNVAYRFWRVGCPVPIVDTRTGEILAWKMPECGRRETVVCDTESEI